MHEPLLDAFNSLPGVALVAFPRRKLKNCVRRLNEDLRHPRVFAVRSVAYRLAHVFSEAIKHKSFEMDAERIRNLRFADERTGETVWI